MMPNLFAYSVTDTDEETAVVVFAKMAAVARRMGANQLGISFEEVSSCTRVKDFDQYAPGPVPIRAYLAAGWWWQCRQCGMRFTEVGRHIERTKSDEAAYQPFDPVEDGENGAYCCAACKMEEFAELRSDQAKIHAAIEAATIKWPMASGMHTTMLQSRSKTLTKPVPWDGTVGGRFPFRAGELGADYFYEVMVSMRLPKLEHPCTWVVGEQTMRVSETDAAVFKALYGVQDQFSEPSQSMSFQ